MNNEELLHAVMNPDEPWNETDTNTYTNDVVFAPTSEGYDPYTDLEKLRRLESVVHQKNRLNQRMSAHY